LIAANKGIKEAEEQLSKYDIEQYIESSDLEFALYRANRKDLNAMLLVAQYFLKQEKSEAIDWLNMLAEKKVVEAFRLLGDIYAEGKCGVEKNYAEAAKWYEKGESAGDNIATRKLIFLYADSLVGGEKAKDIAKEKATQFVEKNKNVPKTQKELYQDILLLNKILGDINFQKKEYRQAIKHYNFYIRNYEDSLQSPDYLIESFYNMGRSSAGMKNWEEAAHYLDLALSTTKQYEKILSNPKSKKADILYERGCVAFEAYKLKQENIYKVCEFFQLARELGKPTPEEIRTECIIGKSGG
ncbi:MAG: hypothetical protein NZ521_06780, partial [Flammeovirgaceae bacterium]|nr:hypothetical protein [Flammeovirgaceae bacterium]MDW8287940.1 hypothetical protein [Flammeovirgaceae bacterium]